MRLDVPQNMIMLYSGRSDGMAREGVGLVLTPESAKALRCWRPISGRVLEAEFLTQKGALTIIVAYAPTEQAESGDKDAFYLDLDSAMGRAASLAIVAGDFNARIGAPVPNITGQYGLEGVTNDNGDRMLQFALAYGMCITNTIFPHKTIHQATWYPPDASAKPSMKDFIMVRRRMRPDIQDTRVYRGANVDSDHRLVVTTVRLRWQSEKRARLVRLDRKALQTEEIRKSYHTAVRQAYLECMHVEGVEEMCSTISGALRQATESVIASTKRCRPSWISQETLDMVECKRQAFQSWQQTPTTAIAKEEYCQLRLLVKKLVKRDKMVWWDSVMCDMENDMAAHRHGSFFRKMQRLTNSGQTPVDVLLDDKGIELVQTKEKLQRWCQHFRGVLNVDRNIAVTLPASPQQQVEAASGPTILPHASEALSGCSSIPAAITQHQHRRAAPSENTDPLQTGDPAANAATSQRQLLPCSLCNHSSRSGAGLVRHLKCAHHHLTKADCAAILRSAKEHLPSLPHLTATTSAADLSQQQAQCTGVATAERDIDRSEVREAIRGLRNGKAAGGDEIAAEWLKYGPPELEEWLTKLLQQVWRTGVVPQAWRDAIVIPLFKKKDRRVCDNYRGISLLSVVGKILTSILLKRLAPLVDGQLLECQCGFRKGRGTTDQIWMMSQLAEKAREYNIGVLACMVDLTKAYDSIPRAALMAVLRHRGLPEKIVRLIESLHQNTHCRVRLGSEVSDEFQVTTGVRQGCVLSPVLFNIYIDHIIREALTNMGGGLQLDYRLQGELNYKYRDKPEGTLLLQALLYADDTVLLAESQGQLQHMVDALHAACTRWGMEISVEKTKVLPLGNTGPLVISIAGQSVETVSSFNYLGSTINSDGNVGMEVEIRLGKAATSYQMWRRKVFRSPNLSIATKMRVFRLMVMSILLYGCETWAVTVPLVTKMQTFCMRCLRDIVGVSKWDQWTNEAVLERAGEYPVGEQIRRRRMQWLGHLERMSPDRVQRAILRARPTGRTRTKGGQKQRWIDVVNEDLKDVPDWRSFVRDRGKWRNLWCRRIA